MSGHLIRQGAAALQALAGRPAPIYAHFGVTHRCNMRCRMCDVWRSGDAGSELTADQIDVLAAGLARAGTRWVALGGGEPFVREDVAALVGSFARRGMEVRLLTNGVGIPDARIVEVGRAGLSHVSISLDTLDADRQRSIYGGVDVMDDILASMRRFREVLPPRSTPVINVCVSRLNLDELPALVTFAAERGFHASFVPVALAATAEDGDGFAAHAPDLALGPAEQARVEDVYARLLTMKRQGAPIANSSRFLRDSARHLKDGTYPWSCDAGLLYLSVSPEGDVSICHQYPAFTRYDDPDLIGQLRARANRRVFETQRDACAGCMRPCWAEVTHVFRNPRAALEALSTLRPWRGHRGGEG